MTGTQPVVFASKSFVHSETEYRVRTVGYKKREAFRKEGIYLSEKCRIECEISYGGMQYFTMDVRMNVSDRTNE